MGADARIARLRLATCPDTRSGVACARALIEDALRTEAAAAGPGAARGLLVLRSLDAGAVGAQKDRPAVQRRVGRSLAEAGRRALHPLDQRAPDADVVLFRDPLETYALYAEALFRRSRLAEAWFFRAIFGDQKQGAPLEAGRRLLMRAAEEPFGALAVADVIAHAGPHAPSLVSSLATIEASRILGSLVQADDVRSRATAAPSSDIEVGSDTAPSSHHRAIPPAAWSPVREAVRRLGEHDSRALLLVAALLIKATGRTVSLGGVRAVVRGNARREARPEPSRPEPASRSPIGSDPTASRTGETIPAPGASPDGKRARRDGLDEIREQARGAHDDATSFDHQAAAGDAPLGTSDGAAEGPRRDVIDALRANSALYSGLDDAASHDREHHALLSRDDHRTSTNDTATVDAASTFDAASTVDAASMVTAASTFDRPWGEPTAWAGGVLLVPAVERLLGVLVACPEALNADFGRRLLERMLRRAGCRDDDPMLGALGSSARPPLPMGPFRFHLPAAFELFGGGDLALHRLDGHPGWRALSCRRRRIVLAMWRGRAPEAVRSWLQSRTIRRERALPPDPTVVVLRSADLTIRAWVRRVTGYRLGRVIARSGWVRSTRSHLDVTFDAGLVDLAVRRAGLDLNPGWCLWLFRVVTIHYDHGADDD
ncbi:MAG: hypothetical protein OEU92_16190 [Alphaproteobacteria bacterium]|nr:hypothetical protein [Alphaproteobacteria bacterium]